MYDVISWVVTCIYPYLPHLAGEGYYKGKFLEVSLKVFQEQNILTILNGKI